MTWIQTSMGKKFLLFAPSVSDVCLDDIAGPLSRLCRWNGQCKCFYSVAQHSLHVSDLLARSGASLRLQMIGLLHDAHEAYTGDIVSPLKHHLYADLCDTRPPLLESEVISVDEMCAVISQRIFQALIPGMSSDGCETGAEGLAWCRADRQALVTEAHALFDYPPLEDWHLRYTEKADPYPLEIPLSCEFVETLFRDRYHSLLYRMEGVEA